MNSDNYLCLFSHFTDVKTL